MSEVSNIVEIKNLIKIYKTGSIEVVALQDLSLNVVREEILCIMGPSGSGKTTLLNQIGAIDRPSSGTITSCGKDLTKMKENELANYRAFDIGFLFQDFNLNPVLTAQDNIILPMKIAGRLSREEQNKKATELLKRVDLKERANHKPHELSGGEKQRIALLSAVANEPRILIADEPTGELDSTTTEEILNLLKDFNKEFGITNVIVTHNPLVSKIADRILNLRDGRFASEYNLNIDREKGETPSFEMDSNIVLQYLYPPQKCSNCSSEELKLQKPADNPLFYARSTHGLKDVKIGFAHCAKCSHINWGFQPVR